MSELARLISEAPEGVEVEFITDWCFLIEETKKWIIPWPGYAIVKITNKTGLKLVNFYAHISCHGWGGAPNLEWDYGGGYNEVFEPELLPDQITHLFIEMKAITRGEGFVHIFFWAEFECFRAGFGQTIADQTKLPYKIE